MRLFIATLCIMWGTIFPSVASEDLQVIAFNVPPYSIVSEKENTGYVTELVKAATAAMSHKVSIEIYPVLRGIYKAKTTKNILLYPLMRQPHLEEHFHWLEQVSSSNSYLFKFHSRNDIQILSLSEAKDLRVGVVRGSTLIQSLKNNGVNNINTVSDGVQNILKLEKGRIDLLASDELMLSHIIDLYNRENRENKLDLSMFVKVIAIPVKNNEMYIAMGKNSSPELVSEIKSSFRSVRQSGKLIEVAHFWTNEHEQAQVNVYKKQLASKGYQWVDYTYDGGGGENLSKVLEARKQIDHFPHAMQHYVGPQIKSWAKMGLLLPLDKIARQQDWDTNLTRSVRDSISYQGSYYAAPANFQRVNWMWLNTKLFKDAGLEIPTTWDAFFNAAEKFMESGINPVALGGYPWQEGTLFESMVLGLGGVEFHRKLFIELDAEAFRSDTMAEILSKLKRVVGYTDNKRAGRTWVQATEMIINGEAAVYFMGDWVKTIFDERQFPYGDSGYICVPVPGTSNVFLSNVDSFVFPDLGMTHREGQMALASTIMSKKSQEEFNLFKGSIPVRLDTPLAKFDDCSKLSSEAAFKYEAIPSFNFIQVQAKEIQKPVIDIVSRFINTELSVEETVAELYTTVNKYNKQFSEQAKLLN